MSNSIGCRFCRYTVPRYYTTEDGRKRHGYHLLFRHIEEKHYDEWENVCKQLDAEFALEEE